MRGAETSASDVGRYNGVMTVAVAVDSVREARLLRSARTAHRLAGFAAAVVCLLVSGCASAPSRSDEHVARVEMLALLQTLNSDLLSHDSATTTLERWCASHRLADPARIIAKRARGAEKPLPDTLRARLAIGQSETVGYRHVELACGSHVLSEADNWYVPGRLSEEMNRRLETTDEPFGKVVAPLHFQRRTLSAQLLWSPLPDGWEVAATRSSDANAPLRIPRRVLRHEAVLSSEANTPFSAVVETYTNALFDFGAWPARLDSE